jgi:hypothetical protein
MTGEESETCPLELKNVSLHIKRGEREWGSGMVGGLKWLVGKDAKKDERLCTSSLLFAFYFLSFYTRVCFNVPNSFTSFPSFYVLIDMDLHIYFVHRSIPPLPTPERNDECQTLIRHQSHLQRE